MITTPTQLWEETLDARPAVDVEPSEYHRLLSYPAGRVPEGRSAELAAQAIEWFAAKGNPWLYMREAELEFTADSLRIDGVDFENRALRTLFEMTDAERVVLVAVSAGTRCDERIKALWQEGNPDEYFFLSRYASAVVEHLIGGLNDRVCSLAEREGLKAAPHYSPGFTGWSLKDQHRLLELITCRQEQPFPDHLEVLPSGMLTPENSQLAVVGLGTRVPEDLQSLACGRCSQPRCSFRRRDRV